jgi:hypothetical protein
MLKIVTIALAFAVLIVAEVKLQPRSISGEVCSYNCLFDLQLGSLDQGI